jgi:hypothetical protein
MVRPNFIKVTSIYEYIQMFCHFCLGMAAGLGGLFPPYVRSLFLAQSLGEVVDIGGNLGYAEAA